MESVVTTDVDGDMWCYQKPGYESLLLAELQRQQQCSQFCDTLLKAEGVSVPAHSCILSAISPHISSALSSTPTPPAGQSHLLEFRALGVCTLFHVVQLLYSGQMAGEGEREKQEAISAAAKLGIHGLVEVTKRDCRNKKREGEHSEVGVQTEPLTPEGVEMQQGRWRREVRDNGSVILGKGILSNGGKDVWTQTEELEINTDPPAQVAASFETIDMAALQSSGQTHLFPPEIVPISIVHIDPPNENESPQPSSSAPSASVQESTAAGCTSVPSSLPHYSSQTTQCGADPQGWWASQCRDAIAAGEWEDEQFEQFQGNIPGFINYFLNPDREEGSSRGRATRKRRAGVGAEKTAIKPQAKTTGRVRGGCTQRVDAQEVGGSKLQKLFLHRCGMTVPRTGQGGGAAGRHLYLKTRELVKAGERRRGRGKLWNFSQSGDVLPCGEGGGRRGRGRGGGGGNAQRGKKNTAQQFNQEGLLVGRARKSRAKSSSVSSSRLYSVPALCAPPAASYVSPALSLLHTASLPPPAPPPQPEHIDRLLEEVMMGLDILPNNNNSGAPHSQRPLSTSSSSSLALNKQQCRAAAGLRRSSEGVAVTPGPACSRSANCEVPVLQQQCEGELNEMLDQFLQSFEQHVESCSAEKEMGDERLPGASSQPSTVRRKCNRTTIQSRTPHTPQPRTTHPPQRVRHSQTKTKLQRDETPRSQSEPRKAPAHPKRTKETAEKIQGPAKCRRKRKSKSYRFSLEKKKRVRKRESSGDTRNRIQENKQLQQRPVVKLERRGLLPVRVTLQGLSCQSLEDKTRSSSVKCSCDSSSAKKQPWTAKTYPIRSKFREAQVMDTVNNELTTAVLPSRRRSRPRKNTPLLSLSNSESSAAQIQSQPVEPCDPEEQPEKNQETCEEEVTVLPQEEGGGRTRTAQKRGAESSAATSDDPTRTKRVCLEQMVQLTCETCTGSSESAGLVTAAAQEEVIDVETVSLSGEGDRLQGECEIKLRESDEGLTDEGMESSTDEILDVEGDHETLENIKAENDCNSRTANPPSRLVDVRPSVSPSQLAKESSAGSTRSREEEEDIDVIGASCPVPDPVVISWTESSEGEGEEGDEDVDVIDVEMTSSAIFTNLSKGSLVNPKYQTEVLLH